jgi:hypothetical protein
VEEMMIMRLQAWTFAISPTESGDRARVIEMYARMAALQFWAITFCNGCTASNCYEYKDSGTCTVNNGYHYV